MESGKRNKEKIKIVTTSTVNSYIWINLHTRHRLIELLSLRNWHLNTIFFLHCNLAVVCAGLWSAKWFNSEITFYHLDRPHCLAKVNTLKVGEWLFIFVCKWDYIYFYNFFPNSSSIGWNAAVYAVVSLSAFNDFAYYWRTLIDKPANRTPHNSDPDGSC